MPIGCTVWDMTNDKCFDFDEAKTTKKIVLKLQCQSCNHYSQHPIKVLSHFSYAKLNQVCHHLFYLNLSWLPVSQRCKHSEIIGATFKNKWYALASEFVLILFDE